MTKIERVASICSVTSVVQCFRLSGYQPVCPNKVDTTSFAPSHFPRFMWVDPPTCISVLLLVSR